MLETIWNFISDNWVWFVVGGFVALSFGRAMNKHPKYRLKEIVKNPLRIFWLFAKAVDEAADTINDAVDVAKDIIDLVEPIAGDGKVGKAIKQADDIIDAVNKANEVLEAVDNIAEKLGIEDQEEVLEAAPEEKIE